MTGNLPDWIVLRHHESIPDRWRDVRLEGAWRDKRAFSRDNPQTFEAYTVATGEIVFRDDGAAGEVWEIHLTAAGVERMRRKDTEHA